MVQWDVGPDRDGPGTWRRCACAEVTLARAFGVGIYRREAIESNYCNGIGWRWGWLIIAIRRCCDAIRFGYMCAVMAMFGVDWRVPRLSLSNVWAVSGAVRIIWHLEY